jgi:hypothetical protein
MKRSDTIARMKKAQYGIYSLKLRVEAIADVLTKQLDQLNDELQQLTEDQNITGAPESYCPHCCKSTQQVPGVNTSIENPPPGFESARCLRCGLWHRTK